MGLCNRVPGLLSALPVLEIRFADEFPASTDPFLGRVDYDGCGIQLFLLDQKGPQAFVVSTSIATVYGKSGAPARFASRLAGSRSLLD
jgi:hypothetical protein